MIALTFVAWYVLPRQVAGLIREPKREQIGMVQDETQVDRFPCKGADVRSAFPSDRGVYLVL